MSEYTAEDFKNARFAEHEDWGTAARTDDTKYPLWFVAKTGEPWFMEDHEMAESGWRPVHERGVRILSRAPHPWQDLADVLADMGHMSPTGHARDLYERGVRVTGGEES